MVSITVNYRNSRASLYFRKWCHVGSNVKVMTHQQCPSIFYSSFGFTLNFGTNHASRWMDAIWSICRRRFCSANVINIKTRTSWKQWSLLTVEKNAIILLTFFIIHCWLHTAATRRRHQTVELVMFRVVADGRWILGVWTLHWAVPTRHCKI